MWVVTRSVKTVVTETRHTMTDQGLTYEGTGVNYAAMDPAKVNAQEIGRTTAGNLERHGYREVTASRGESCYLIENDVHFLALVIEGLGSKNLVTDVMWHLLGAFGYEKAAQDTVAMIVNDMITLGALPMVVGQYLGLGSDRWLTNPARSGSLALGWADACNQAGAVYGSGETPTLRDIIYPTAADIAGAAMGIIQPKDRRIDPATIAEGDDIVLLGGTGVHANGLTLIRDLSDVVSFKECLEDGRMFGEAVLDPTPIYVPVIAAVLDAGIRPHYAVNITGHGWRKLMRAEQPFAYVMTRVPDPQPIFSFIQHHGRISDREMYGNYNMGAGFAIYVKSEDSARVIELSQACGIEAWVCGHIEKCDKNKKVVIEPIDLEYDENTLSVR